MVNLNSMIHRTLIEFQDKKFTLLMADIFTELITDQHFKKQAVNALMAMQSYSLFELGKTNIKIQGNIFLLLINKKQNLLILLSQNAIYESGTNICNEKDIAEQFANIQSYQKIPDIYLAYPLQSELNSIELDEPTKIKFLKYKDEIVTQIKKYRPSLFERLNNIILGLICDYQTLRTQLLKFIAVVPALTNDKTGATLKSSFLETAASISNSKEQLPFYIKPTFILLKFTTPFLPGNIFKYLVEKSISFVAGRFICTENKLGATKIIKKLHLSKRNCTFDQLGELVICQEEADEYCQKITDLIKSPTLFESALKLNKAGIPSHHISIKTSALTPHFNEDPDAFLFVYNDIKMRLLKLFNAAEKNNVFLNFDAEHYHYRDLTVKLIFHFLSEHQNFNKFPYFGFVLQAYLKDSQHHLNMLLEFFLLALNCLSLLPKPTLLFFWRLLFRKLKESF